MTIRAALIAFLLVGIAGTASARTPTPTATPTLAPPATATSVAPEPAEFGVLAWVNGKEQVREVTAWIGGTLCATGATIYPSGGSRVVFRLTVPSEEVVPGCGYEGAIVTFRVDGQQAPQTAVWHSRPFPGAEQTVNLIIGPPFARVSGWIGPSRVSPRQSILPYMGNVPCGHGQAGDPGDAYEAVVYSAEQQAGCGVEGSQVTFKLLDAQGNVIAVARETGTWHAWDGVSDLQHLDLTFGPAGVITMPGTGDGPPRDANGFGALAIAFSGVGVAAVAMGAVMRRRASTR